MDGKLKCGLGKAARVVFLGLLLFSCAAWSDSLRARAKRGNRLYFHGKYEEAEKAYGEGLVDYPTSDILHFNMAAAQYRLGKYDEAILSLDKIQVEDTSDLAAAVAYNRGNAQFKLAENSAKGDPQAGLALYTQALASFRRAMALDPTNLDAKFNHELVEKRMLELKEKIEEARKKQEHSEERESESAGEKEQEQPQPPEQKNEPADAQRPQPRGGQQDTREEGVDSGEEGGAGVGKQETRSMSAQEARALVEAAKGEEVQPSEISRRMLGAMGLGEPLKDW